jgi:hypothetical protein
MTKAGDGSYGSDAGDDAGRDFSGGEPVAVASSNRCALSLGRITS